MAQELPCSDVITIRLLGTPEIRCGSQLVRIPRLKSRALLFYMAAHTEAISRGQLLAIFWPDLDISSARHNLRSTIYTLRQKIGAALQVEKEWLSLNPRIQIDVRTFTTEISQGRSDISRLSSVLKLYRGDFLAGFASPGLATFEDWITVERERFRRLGVKGFVALKDLHEAKGDFNTALEVLEQALSFDPLQEDLQRACLRLHHLTGDRTGAIRRYERFRRLLNTEMGVPPMPETRAIYDAIVSDDPGGVLPEPVRHTLLKAPLRPKYAPGETGSGTTLADLSLPFVGRRSELERLFARVDSGVLMLVEGAPGIGKTRLVEAFIESARYTDASVLSLFGRARELERNLPYQPIIEALRNLLTNPSWPELKAGLALPVIWQNELTRLLPELSEPALSPLPLVRSTDESRLWEGIRQLLCALAQMRPLVFALDDLHWADASTLGLLGYLVRQTSQQAVPIFFLGTSRIDATPEDNVDGKPLQTLVRALLRENHLERIQLDRLSEEDVYTLAGKLSSSDEIPLGSWLHLGSEGNPFILAELVRYARDKQILGPGGVLNLDAIPANPVVPQTIQSLVKSRLERLSTSARRILDAAAVVGREFDYEVTARAAALSDQAAIDALEECQESRLIEPLHAYHYTFDHNLTMAVIYQETTAIRRQLLHRHTAEALEKIHHDDPDVVAGTIAFHYGRAGLREKAARYALLAGERAARLAAWQEAVDFYELALAGIEASKRQEVLLALGQAYLQEGRIGQATAILREALVVAQEKADVEAENMAMQVLAESLLIQDYYEDVIDLAGEIIDLGRPEMTAIGHALLGAALSQEGVNLVEASTQLRGAESALQQRSDGQSLVLLAEVNFELGNVFAKQGDLLRAVQHYRAVLELVRMPENETGWRWHILAHNNLAFHLHLLADPQAEEIIQAGMALAREQGTITLLPFLLSTAGEIALAHGDLLRAAGYFREGLALAEQFDHSERIVGLTANLGLVARDLGKTAEAVERLSTALTKAGEMHNHYQATQLRLWLAPLLPESQAHPLIEEAKAMAQKGGYGRLLDEAARLTL